PGSSNSGPAPELSAGTTTFDSAIDFGIERGAGPRFDGAYKPESMQGGCARRRGAASALHIGVTNLAEWYV
ncbi:MAG: hypothetical protein ACREF6_12685, partial [Alphaproteobacteria bacterium]